MKKIVFIVLVLLCGMSFGFCGEPVKSQKMCSLECGGTCDTAEDCYKKKECLDKCMGEK